MLKIEITFDKQDCQRLVSFVDANRHHVFFRQRVNRNVNGPIPPLERENIWRSMAMCLLSTQQRSNYSSPISRFLTTEPFPLSLERCSKVDNLEEFIQSTISDFGGIRFAPKIATQMSGNYRKLHLGEWQKVGDYCLRLLSQRRSEPDPDHYLLEREAACYIQSIFAGFGPKQSRNFWQSLGLFRYEFVLDSRVIKWLGKFGFSLPLSSMAIGEEDYYCYISDLLRAWCMQAEVLPCLFDAAIFASYDEGEWPEDAPVW